MDIPFTKMHGLGNDFMVIDNRSQSYEFNAELIQRWSDRRTGIGFDQLLVVQEPSVENALFDYRIFNADGAEVEHCGNGARCFARFVYERGMTSEQVIPVNTAAGVITLQLLDNEEVTVAMGVPEFTPSAIPLLAVEDVAASGYALSLSEDKVSGLAETTLNSPTELERVTFGALAIGNPHAVLRVHDVDTAPVEQLGPELESHAVLVPLSPPAFVKVCYNDALK